MHNTPRFIPALIFILLSTALALVRGTTTAQWPGLGTAIRSHSGGVNAWRVTAGDFNGDGRLDLVAGRGNEFTVGVLLGKGDGTFQPAINHAHSSLVWDMASGDLNGDGKTDLVTANRNARVSVIFGNGDGTLRGEANYATTSPAEYVARVIVKDLNGDDRPDVAALIPDFLGSPEVAVTLSVLLNEGDGTLQPAANYLVAGNMSNISEAFAADDFNSDGKIDLSVITVRREADNSLSGDVVVLPGMGDGTFGEALRSAVTRVVSTGGLGIFADFNLDGKLDVAAHHHGAAPNLIVYFAAGDGTFQRGPDRDIGLNYPTAAGEFNGDGRTDLVLVSALNFNTVQYTISVLLGNGDGTFQPPSESAAGDEPFSLAVGDFNNDGKPDVAAGSRQSYVSVSLNSVIIPGACQRFTTTTVITDPTGDSADGDPSHDIQSLSISERLSASGEQVMVFTLKVADLTTFRDTTTWRIAFDLPYASYALEANSHTGNISFPHIASGESNFTPDGTINFVIPRNRLDIGPGEELTNVRASVTLQVGEVFDLLDTAPPTVPSPVVYAPGGTRPCSTPTPSPSPTPTPTPSSAPQLLTEEGTNHAIALDSVTFTRDPFTVRTRLKFSPDERTRIILFASNLDLLPGENASDVIVQAEDTNGRVFPLVVENVGKVPGFDWLTQVVVKLPDELEGAGDVQVSISLRGLVSNQAVIAIKVGNTSP